MDACDRGLGKLSRLGKANGNIWAGSWRNWRNYSGRESTFQGDRMTRTQAWKKKSWYVSWFKYKAQGEGKETGMISENNDKTFGCYAMDLLVFFWASEEPLKDPHVSEGRDDRETTRNKPKWNGDNELPETDLKHWL